MDFMLPRLGMICSSVKWAHVLTMLPKIATGFYVYSVGDFEGKANGDAVGSFTEP